jgi:hypothetical protein
MDGGVIYDFPDSYKQFHMAVTKRQEKVLAAPAPIAGQQQLFRRGDDWHPSHVSRDLPHDPVLPAVYQLTSFVAKYITPAMFNGKDWIPNYDVVAGVTYQQLIDEYADPLFVSQALDELLDSGLLRAKDSLLDVSTETFGRTFLPGGEFKALSFSRLAAAWNCPGVECDDVVEAERRDLWGPF